MSETRPYTPEEEKIEAGRMSLEEAQDEAATIQRMVGWGKTYDQASEAIDRGKIEIREKAEEQVRWRKEWEKQYRETHHIPETEPIDILSDIIEPGDSRLREGDRSLIRRAESFIASPHVGVYKTSYADIWRMKPEDQRTWKPFLSEKLKGKVLIDFGGNDGDDLDGLVRFSGASLYVIVDRYIDKKLPPEVNTIVRDEMLSATTRKIAIQADMLEFACQVKDATVNVTINGIDEEAILGPVYYSYARRLRNEFLRMTEPGGVLFGDTSPLDGFKGDWRLDIDDRENLIEADRGIAPQIFEKRDQASMQRKRKENIERISQIISEMTFDPKNPDTDNIAEVVQKLVEIHEDELAIALAPFGPLDTTIENGKILSYGWNFDSPPLGDEAQFKEVLKKISELPIEFDDKHL